MSTIIDIKIRKIIDSRGKPTVEVDVITKEGIGRASAPSGASTGSHEVVAFPDGGIDKAIANYSNIYRKKLIGYDTSDQKGFDHLLHEIDGTSNFSVMGGNLAIASSLAVAKAEANGRKILLYQYLGGKKGGFTLPYLFGNVFCGGKHAIGGTDIQEYLAVSFSKNMLSRTFGNAAAHSCLGKMLQKAVGTVGKGDEGGWVANLSNRDAMICVANACKEVSKDLGFIVRPSLDVAASSLYDGNKYVYREGALDPKKQIDFLINLSEEFNIYSIEDGLYEDAWDDWAELTRRIGKKCLLIGDDLFVTNTERLKKGIAMGACNAVLVKPNQVGTLTETIDVINLAHAKGYKTVLSHRSGETTDDTIAHISVAFSCHGIKTGTVSGERIAKLNELIRIEEMLG